MKLLSPRVHGYVDYAIVVTFLLAPTLFQFGGTAAALCYILAAAHLSMTLMTAFPLGVLKVIPFPVHGALEVVIGVFLVAAPFLLGFSDIASAKYFFIGSGIAVGIVWAATNYRALPARTGEAAMRTRRYA